MKFIMLSVLLTAVCVRNSTNVEFNELPEEKLLDAVCRSFHKQMDMLPSQCDLATTCNQNQDNFSLTEFKMVKNVSTLALPRLVCKEDNMVNFFWDPMDDFSYFFEVRSNNKPSATLTNATTCEYYTITNLSSDSDYTIILWATSFLKKSIIRSDAVAFSTTNKELIPSPVTQVVLRNITCLVNSCDAVIEWIPNKDYSCQYDVIWPTEGYINEETVSVISGRHQAVLKSLNFNTNYTVDIIARHENSPNESRKKSYRFSTPSCLEIYHSLENCRPGAPEHLTVNETIIDPSEGGVEYNVYLRWQKPELLPSYYVAHFANLVKENTSSKILNVTGDKTTAVFDNVELAELYHISLRACSPAGCSEKTVDERHRTDLVLFENISTEEWWIVTLILVPLIIILLGSVVVNYYQAKQKRKEERDRYFTGLNEEKLPESVETIEINLIKQNASDQWELDFHKLSFQNILGEGAFGIVHRAYLEINSNNKISVAVKMLKESSTSDEIRQFTQEINIMKSVRQHPYIVSLIGCITEGRVEGPLLVVEYCSRGDLQSYLRTAWDKFCNMHQEILNAKTSYNNEDNYVANVTYDFYNMVLEEEFIVEPKHLLSIARQVALGMEHLAKSRVVHRDLAARNVLVCEDHTVKVSDFGLSRDIYRDNVYCKSGGGKLPIRWMALESLTHQRYTTHSDVWSFGILLWEIVTLGGTPYVGVHAADLLEFLKNGNRLSCPSNCSLELYVVMQNCWKASPKNRPTFTQICSSLENLLEDVSQYLHLDNVMPSCDTKEECMNKSEETVCSQEHYVKPINTIL